MSYILEALKKSQQERELGQVPTLDAGAFPSEAASARPSPWLLAAVGLAMLAVIIALYAALRGGESLPETGPAAAEAGVASPADRMATPPEAPRAVAPAAPAPQPLPVQAEAPADVPTMSQIPERVVPAPLPGSPEDTGAATQEEEKAPPPSRAAAPKSRIKKADAAIPKRPGATTIPEDVRQDIEAFKDEVLNKRPERAPAAKQEGEMAPQKLRLPPDVQERLPAFLMTVHVYESDPAQRFVLINSLKTKEGERTREGIVLERILPDGAVLSFEGHKFFRHR